MSFADEMRRKSLEVQSNAAEKARREALEALVLKRALEESKRNNCIPTLKKDLQEAASKGLREVVINRFALGDNRRFAGITKLENSELNSFLEMYSSMVDEYDRMRIAFIKSEPGLSLTGVVNWTCDNNYGRDASSCEATVFLKVVW